MSRTVDEFRIEELRSSLAHGKGISQQQVNEVAAELNPAKELFRPTDKNEALPLFDDQGQQLSTTAPLCHLLALRHRCVHILLLWNSPAMGDVLVLQIRDWQKDDSPGHLDISVGGHMTSCGSSAAEDTAFSEMLEETGLTSEDLEEPLKPVGGYPFDECRPKENFHNSEWRDVYIGRLSADAIGKVRFPDGEVAGVVLVPISDAGSLLEQEKVPMASALRKSLPKCLGVLEHNG